MSCRFTLLIVLVSLLAVTPQLLQAAQGRILDGVEAEQAGKDAFEAEEKLFNTIGQSIALSLAYCEIQTSCDPSVDKDELDTLIDKLDDRINNLILKQENSEEDYTDLLTAYVNHRENYIDYQEQLKEIATVEAPLPEEAEKDVFADEAEESEEIVQQEEAVEKPAEEEADFSVFEDIDEALPGTGPDALE